MGAQEPQDVDRRVRRTRRQLREALVQLLISRDLKDISVMELTRLADVNRGTFYLHYRDIYDLYSKIELDTAAELADIVRRHTQSNMKRDLYPVTLDIFEFFADNTSLCMMLLQRGDGGFIQRLLDHVKPASDAEWRALLGDTDPALREYCYSFITSGFIGLAKSWFISGMTRSPKEMAELAIFLMRTPEQSRPAATPREAIKPRPRP